MCGDHFRVLCRLLIDRVIQRGFDLGEGESMFGGGNPRFVCSCGRGESQSIAGLSVERHDHDHPISRSSRHIASVITNGVRGMRARSKQGRSSWSDTGCRSACQPQDHASSPSSRSGGIPCSRRTEIRVSPCRLASRRPSGPITSGTCRNCGADQPNVSYNSSWRNALGSRSAPRHTSVTRMA